MTPEQRVKKVMEQLDVSRQELSEALEISLSSVAMYFNGHHKIRKVVALAIQSIYGVNAKWILHNEEPMFVKKIDAHLSDDTIKLAMTYSTLPKKSQELVRNIIRALKRSKDPT